jgi:hypothetical protein
MKTVKTFGNLSEAGFASSLLEAEGIPASLADESSFQLVAGMQMQGIRLQVEDQDYERAVRILQGGSDAPPLAELPAASDAQEEPGKTPVGLFVSLIVGFIFLGFAIHEYWASRQREASEFHTYRYDYNHDGKPDYILNYRRGKLIKSEADRNFDGMMDAWTFYDSEERPEHEEFDENFDGRPDLWVFYKNGQPVRFEQDTDFNGQPDWFGTYENGQLVRMDCRPNGSSIVVRRKLFEHGIVREELVDDQGDGHFHYKILHDPFGNVSEHLPIEPAK